MARSRIEALNLSACSSAGSYGRYEREAKGTPDVILHCVSCTALTQRTEVLVLVHMYCTLPNTYRSQAENY